MRPRKAAYGDPRRCENCRHFEQHYVRHIDDSYTPCYCGHCKYPRLKPVNPDMVCDEFRCLHKNPPSRN